jgi:hypothetical protein
MNLPAVRSVVKSTAAPPGVWLSWKVLAVEPIT